MTSLADQIRPLLIVDPSVFSLIGFIDKTLKVNEIKSFRGTFPLKTKLPCITYADIIGVPGDLVPRDYSFQITAWGSNDVECQTVADAVENALDSWTGNLDGRDVEKIVCYFWSDSAMEANTSLWYSIRKFEALFW